MPRQIWLCLAMLLAVNAAYASSTKPTAHPQAQSRTARKPGNPYHFKRGVSRHKIPHAPYHAIFPHGAHHPLIRPYH